MTGEQWNTIALGDTLKTSTGKLVIVTLVEGVGGQHPCNRLTLLNPDGRTYKTRDSRTYELAKKAAPTTRNRTWEEQGGSAFPVCDVEDSVTEYGMPLRDYFAAKAIQGLLSGVLAQGCISDEVASPEYWANKAYVFADAMLAERAK